MERQGTFEHGAASWGGVADDQRWPASGGCSSVSCFADTEIFNFICLFGRVSSGEKQQHEVCQTINGDFVLSLFLPSIFWWRQG